MFPFKKKILNKKTSPLNLGRALSALDQSSRTGKHTSSSFTQEGLFGKKEKLHRASMNGEGKERDSLWSGKSTEKVTERENSKLAKWVKEIGDN